MSNYICLDASVFIKVLVVEEDSDKAIALMRRIIQSGQLIVLPPFAWAEIGTVLRKKRRRNELAVQEADDMWLEFKQFPGIKYLSDDDVIMDRAWKISRYFDMPTLYDATYLAVAEIVEERTSEICEFWTADERLFNALDGKKKYVMLLQKMC
ncbi:MAG: tRNA(fMet)-specific endonuclease VapC [Pelotomaculum sp. PtaB.Bin013]|uniref:Type II toxin-antitoxin system VapC family toxin n=1 Tax=Pelotomaculum isophthalicicum JI TaxID=947010 RepID=A0A9X4H4X1_9FIRM|nr:type II toxin-antitoxin system VapC family toxin [Pelotomaculum isophthalicicum]MDF9407139.1 type II toxin-antitoxin system VapC family toxin [Pelotomaculum isophthalicicum JI]OPX83173.1 MAG: tRNA(fMet)-specific endonuclease VapC [Pelotomaculum sp. PtaB.Bin013]